MYFLAGSSFTSAGGDLHAVAAQPARSVVISSEPLSRGTANWSLVPRNHMLVVSSKDDDCTSVEVRFILFALLVSCHHSASCAC
jgi:hypothetical protein